MPIYQIDCGGAKDAVFDQGLDTFLNVAACEESGRAKRYRAAQAQ